MGTRLDLYVGRGRTREWLGSLDHDGAPENYPRILSAATEHDYREACAAALDRPDATVPAEEKAWPWDGGLNTDCVIAFDDGVTWACRPPTVWMSGHEVLAKQGGRRRLLEDDEWPAELSPNGGPRWSNE